MTKQKIIPYAKSDVMAIKALFLGTATDGQQRAALNCIMNDVCKFYSPDAFKGEDTHQTAFMLGRRQVWLDLVEIMGIKIEEGTN